MRSLKDRATIAERLALALCVVFFVACFTAGATASSGSKGSSCAHPYRVHMTSSSGPVEGNGNPGEMLGDTHYIKVRWRARSISIEQGYIEGSWAPRVKGLHLCAARMTFDWRKPFVSHQWHRQFVKIPARPGSGHTLSYVVTAAR